MRVFTTGWELGHTGDNYSGTIHEADVTARLMSSHMDTVTNPARNGGRSLHFIPNSSDFGYAGIDVPATNEFWLRTGLLYTQAGIQPYVNTILSWASGAGVVGGLRFQGDNLGLSFWSGSNKLNAGSTEALLTSEASGAFKLNRWHLFEVHWKTDGVTGVAELRLDGTQLITFGGNTDDGQGQVMQIRFGWNLDESPFPAGSQLYYDDCAMDDADWIGDGHVALLRPVGNGNSSQLTGSDGDQIDNWQLVDETPAADSDFVMGAAPALKDTYAMEDTVVADIPTNAEVKHVDVVAMARTDSVGTDALKGVVRTGATDFASTGQTLKGVTSPHRFGFPVNPDTSVPWTLAELDAAEAGVETA